MLRQTMAILAVSDDAEAHRRSPASTVCHSRFGFRPNRSAHTAIAEAKGYLEAGYQTVVDFDLAKFRSGPDIRPTQVAVR
jgi:hypothetical protein